MQPTETDSECSVTGESEDEELHEESDHELILEDWVAWIKRTTDFAEKQLAKACITDWVTEQRKRYWQFAGKIARRSDDRWSALILTWRPQGGVRNVGPPCKRWLDDIAKFQVKTLSVPADDWYFNAQDENTWKELEKQFVETLPIE